MTAGKLGVEVLGTVPGSAASSEVGNNTQSDWVTANAGQVFTEQIGGPTDVAGSRGADHFNMVAFPAHRTAARGPWRCSGDGGKIGDGDREAPVSHDRATERS